jgi:hypothetical protein
MATPPIPSTDLEKILAAIGGINTRLITSMLRLMPALMALLHASMPWATVSSHWSLSAHASTP